MPYQARKVKIWYEIVAPLECRGTAILTFFECQIATRAPSPPPQTGVLGERGPERNYRAYEVPTPLTSMLACWNVTQSRRPEIDEREPSPPAGRYLMSLSPQCFSQFANLSPAANRIFFVKGTPGFRTPVAQERTEYSAALSSVLFRY